MAEKISRLGDNGVSHYYFHITISHYYFTLLFSLTTSRLLNDIKNHRAAAGKLNAGPSPVGVELGVALDR